MSILMKLIITLMVGMMLTCFAGLETIEYPLAQTVLKSLFAVMAIVCVGLGLYGLWVYG